MKEIIVNREVPRHISAPIEIFNRAKHESILSQPPRLPDSVRLAQVRAEIQSLIRK
jgi:hypothetical protein